MSVTKQSDNQVIAERLREMAELLDAQGANPFRVGAYRKAGDVIAGLHEDVRELFEEQGTTGLEAIPGVGKGIASAIVEMLTTGRWIQLQRLRGTVDPCTLFQTIPGVGKDLAEKIHDLLAVDTLEALEAAWKAGLHGSEIDLRTSLDGIVLLMHDETLNRTTDGSGQVKNTAWNELQTYRLKDGQGNLSPCRIPSFARNIDRTS